MFAACLKTMLVVGALLTVPVFCRADEPNFERFTSRQGAYTVELPIMPQLTPEQTDDYRAQTVFAEQDSVRYTVVCFETMHGWKEKKPQETLKGWRSVEHKGLAVKIQEDQEISLGKDKVPGRSYLVIKETDFGYDVYIREQMFLKGKRLYMISARGSDRKVLLESASVNRFLASFALIDPAPAEVPLQKFPLEQGRFSVSLPGKPDSREETVGRYKSINYAAAAGSMTFRVQVVDTGVFLEDEDPMKALEAIRSELRVKLLKSDRKMRHFFHDRKLEQSRLPGLGYEIEVRQMGKSANASHHYERMYFAGSSVYILSAETSDEKALNCDTVMQFLSSFDVARP